MIIGIGIDLVELSDVKHVDKLAKKIFTSQEYNLFLDMTSEKRKREFVAGRFAAKEAYVKAIGTGIGKIGFKDIEVLKNEAGAPYIMHSEFCIHVSITHTNNYAQSIVIIEK